MMNGSPIVWDDVILKCRHGNLMKLLENLPREDWNDRAPSGGTLLHFACLGPNIKASMLLIKSKLFSANERDNWNNTPAHFAAVHAFPSLIEILCAAGADLRALNRNGYAPIDEALGSMHMSRSIICVHVLVANGVRLSTVHPRYRFYITREMETFERGVLKCRKVFIATLRVKRAGKLWRWDKYLLREIGFAIWATRYDNKWSTL